MSLLWMCACLPILALASSKHCSGAGGLKQNSIVTSENTCLSFVPTVMYPPSFWVARGYCKEYGGDLAVVRTPQKQRELNLLLAKGCRRSEKNCAMIGAISKGNDWYWVDKSEEMTFTNWAEDANLPAKGTAFYCIAVSRQLENKKIGEWRPIGCSWTDFPGAFVCEKRLSKSRMRLWRRLIKKHRRRSKMGIQ